MRTRPRVDVLVEHGRTAAAALAAPAGVLVLTVVIDRWARRLADIPVDRLDDTSLVLAALRGSPLLAAVGALAGAGVALAARRGDRGALVRWSELDGGRAQQVLVGLAGGLLAWRYATTAYDYLFEQWHTADRLLLVALAVASVVRPVALVPLVAVVRILRAPFLVPFAFSPAQNVDQLLVLVLAVVAAGYLLTVLTGRRSAPAVLGLAVAVVAMHFFVPGRAKLALGWYGSDHLADLPLNGHAQGWLGSGDGDLARWLSDAFGVAAPFLRGATVGLELGALVAVAHRRLAAIWLVGFVGFHVVVGAALGFSFLDWLVVEAALLVLLLHPRWRDWSSAAFRPGVVVVALATVLVGGRLFAPPRLAWIDGPLVYAYEIDGIDAAGRRVALDDADFAPYDQAFAFAVLPLGPLPPLAQGYGAIDAPVLDALAGVESVGGLREVELAWAHDADGAAGTDGAAEAVWVLEQFLDATGRGRAVGDHLVGPPRHFWTERPGPGWDGRTPLVRLEVTRVTTLRTPDGELHRREPVVVIDRDGEDHEVTFASR